MIRFGWSEIRRTQDERPAISGPLDNEYGFRTRCHNRAPLRPTRLSFELEEVVAARPFVFGWHVDGLVGHGSSKCSLSGEYVALRLALKEIIP